MLRQLAKGAIRLSTLGLKTGTHVTRFAMYESIAAAMQEIPVVGNEVLEISWSEDLVNLLKIPSVKLSRADFDKGQENPVSILALPFADNSFDYVVSDQVLEHVKGNPQDAINETYRVLKPGGIAIHTTCVIQELHELPDDYFRCTPNGLKYLCREFSEIIEASSWGNRWAFLGFRYFEVPLASWHPLHMIAMKNDPEFAMATWIVAVK